MGAVGIIAEFNPFHNGHKYLIDSAKAFGEPVICVIGDDFTQRGDVAVVSKYARAEMALACGADLCILMPSPWSMSCANNFAVGAMSILKNLGIVDKVVFGSECGDAETIKKVASALNNEYYSALLNSELKKGITFAAARENAISKILGEDAKILENANDTLAVEYVSAGNSLDFFPDYTTIKRKGNPHDSALADKEFLSASSIRNMLLNGDLNSAKEYMPQKAFDVLKREYDNGRVYFIDNIESAIIAYLRRLKPEELAMLPEISEGLENRVYNVIRTATTLENCYKGIKTKRYTLARIRRIILSAYLSMDTSLFLDEVPYIKILGFNEKGEEILKSLSCPVPIILRAGEYNELQDKARKCFELQQLASDLYALAAKEKQPTGSEFTAKIIKLK